MADAPTQPAPGVHRLGNGHLIEDGNRMTLVESRGRARSGSPEAPARALS